MVRNLHRPRSVPFRRGGRHRPVVVGFELSTDRSRDRPITSAYEHLFHTSYDHKTRSRQVGIYAATIDSTTVYPSKWEPPTKATAQNDDGGRIHVRTAEDVYGRATGYDLARTSRTSGLRQFR